MSYRYRLGSFPKSELSKYLNKDYEQLEKEFGDESGWYNFADPDELREIEYLPALASIFDDKEVTKNWKNFYDFSLKDYGYDLYILEKEDLLKIIDVLALEVSNHYEELYEEMSKDLEFESEDIKSRLASLVMGKKNDWTKDYGMNHSLALKEDDMRVSKSGRYEYIVLNLVAISKMFDWENNYLILNGW